MNYCFININTVIVSSSNWSSKVALPKGAEKIELQMFFKSIFQNFQYLAPCMLNRNVSVLCRLIVFSLAYKRKQETPINTADPQRQWFTLSHNNALKGV